MKDQLFDFFKVYYLELFLLSIAIVVTGLAFLLFFVIDTPTEKQSSIESEKASLSMTSSDIVIDIAGAVNNPGLYKMPFGARLKDAIDRAGGTKNEIDEDFFEKNYNLAESLADGQKIYIPSKSDVQEGYVAKNSTYHEASNSKININTASLSELDSLPGIGPALASKIINSRSYSSGEELIEKKVLTISQYQKIQNLIRLD